MTPTNPSKLALVGLSARTHKEAQRVLTTIVRASYAERDRADHGDVVTRARAILPEWRITYNRPPDRVLRTKETVEDVWVNGWRIAGRLSRPRLSLEERARVMERHREEENRRRLKTLMECMGYVEGSRTRPDPGQRCPRGGTHEFDDAGRCACGLHRPGLYTFRVLDEEVRV